MSVYVLLRGITLSQNCNNSFTIILYLEMTSQFSLPAAIWSIILLNPSIYLSLLEEVTPSVDWSDVTSMELDWVTADLGITSFSLYRILHILLSLIQ